MDSSGENERMFDVSGALWIALFCAIVVAPLSIYLLPLPYACLGIAVIGWLLYEAKKRWDFDIWEWWWPWNEWW